MEPEERKAWGERLGIVGRAQARYLWLLLILGLFYLALHFRLANGTSPSSDELVVPFINLSLSSLPVWASGPFVLSVLLLAAHGSLRAFRTGAEALSIESFGVGEQYDVAPNALDFVVYTTAKSPKWARALLLFTYPLYMALFCGEAWWLLWAVYIRQSLPAKGVFLGLGLVGLVFATWRVASYILRNARRALAVWRGEDNV